MHRSQSSSLRGELSLSLVERQPRHSWPSGFPASRPGDRHAVHVTFPQAEHRPPLVSAKRMPQAWHVHGTILFPGVIPLESPQPHNDLRLTRGGRELWIQIRSIVGRPPSGAAAVRRPSFSPISSALMPTPTSLRQNLGDVPSPRSELGPSLRAPPANLAAAGDHR